MDAYKLACMVMTDDTQDVLRRYFDAWTNRRSAETASLLAADFRFEAGPMVVEGRDAFLDAGAFPADAKVTMVAEAYQHDIGFQLYDAMRAGRAIRVVEQLTVRDGAIVSSRFITDGAAFAAFVAP